MKKPHSAICCATSKVVIVLISRLPRWIAAHLGALAEQARARMQLDLELVRRGLVDLLLEALERLRQEVRRRRGGREAEQDLVLRLRRGRRGDAGPSARCECRSRGERIAFMTVSNVLLLNRRSADELQSGGLISTLSLPMPAISASILSPGAEERTLRHADTGRRTGEHHVARIERHQLGGARDLLGDRIDHLAACCCPA